MRPSYTIEGGGLAATFTDLGAVLCDLRLAGHAPPLVLGLADLDHYPEHSNYMGATAGRVANRIGGARFGLGGAEHRTDPNFRGRHTLHGGAAGTGRRRWTVAALERHEIRFGLDLADGEMGFPGAMTVSARFTCAPDATLRIEYEARTSRPTPCSFAHHSYWTLDGEATIADHELTVHADRYLAVDDDLIPAAVRPVEGTAFDFRRGRALPAEGLLDHNLCLSDAPAPLREVAILRSRRSGVAMRVATTEPGLQVYDGARLDTPVPGLEGRRYGAHAGCALEPQGWPDAVNHADFPSCILRPGETYRQVSTFSFAKG